MAQAVFEGLRTSDRLETYKAFDQDIIRRVSTVADMQRGYSFTELARRYRLDAGPETVLPSGARKPIEVLRFMPKQDYDTQRVRVFSAAMATGIDENITMMLMRFWGTDPSTPLIAIGNRAWGRRTGRLSLRECVQVAQGDLRPTVRPALRYLTDQRIVQADQLGYSYGADKAAVMTSEAAKYDIAVGCGVYLNSAAVTKNGLLRLAHRFAGTAAKMESYIKQSSSQAYREARAVSDVGMARFGAVLLTPTNVAIGSALAQDHFVGRAKDALDAQPNMRAAIGWGTASEFGCNEVLPAATADLQEAYPGRVTAMPLDGMYHAGCNDIDLFAAMMLQGLRDTRG